MPRLSDAVDEALAEAVESWGWDARYFTPREFFEWAYRQPRPESVPWFESFMVDAESFPPCSPDKWRSIWMAMKRAAKAADIVRMDVGPLIVTPAGGVRFRDVFPDKFAKTPGSRHFIGDGLDLKPQDKSTSAQDVFRFADAAQRNGDIPKGGLHAYASGFCHLDTRGEHARWAS